MHPISLIRYSIWCDEHSRGTPCGKCATLAADFAPFRTAKQQGLVAGDGEPCWNDHDPDCRWPDCNCRRVQGVMQPMPKTSREKQEDFRARNAMLGLTEVRGIYLPPELHSKLKQMAAELLKKHKPTEGS